jgi:predicted RNA binding protein YcfA (HicA-like mRNA interferase family)
MKIVEKIEMEKQLEWLGFKKIEGSKHRKFKHPDGRITVLRRSQKYYYGSELREIEEQAGVEFCKTLRELKKRLRKAR